MPEHENRGLHSDAEFDHQLQSALNTYADPGQDWDITQRVLAHAAAEHVHKKARGWLPWAVALPVAACFIVLTLVTGSRPTRNITDRTSQARVTQPKPIDIRGDGPSSITILASARYGKAPRAILHPAQPATRGRTRRLPKLDVFPAPQPLTPGEEELVAYIAHAPESELQSLIDAQKQIDAPLSIAAIEIHPLRPPEPAGN